MTRDIVIAVAIGVPWTIALTAASFAIGALLGMPLCMLRLSRWGVLRLLTGSTIVGLRSVPPLLWIFLIYFGLGTGYISIGPFESAAVGLGLITAANMSEIYRGALTAIHYGQWEAANALGLPAASRWRDVIGPQLLRIALPSSAGYAVGLLKDSAIASTIGVAEVTFAAQHIARDTFRGFEVYMVAGFCYVLMSLPIAALARIADLRLRARVAL